MYIYIFISQEMGGSAKKNNVFVIRILQIIRIIMNKKKNMNYLKLHKTNVQLTSEIRFKYKV